MRSLSLQTAIPVLLVMMISLITQVSAQTHTRLSFKKPMMGTQVRIVLYATDSLVAAEAVKSAFARISELNQHLSDYLTESELNRLSNTHDQSVLVEDDLWQVLTTAQEISNASDGAFDVTTGRVTRLWRWAMRRKMLPDSSTLGEAMESVGYKFLHLNSERQTVRLQKDKMRLDLGGIAKGYAADQALDVLKQKGFAIAAVNVGGDIALGEAPPNSDGWSIQVFEGESDADKMILSNCGIAVSGDAYRYFEDQGQRYSHIVDPVTGYGVTHERKVAVIAPTSMIADAWASAYSVMNWNLIPVNLQERQGLSIRILEPDESGARELKTGQFRMK